MIVMFWSFAMTGIVTTAQMKPLMLLLAYFEPFLTPEPVNPLKVDKPSFLSQLNRYSTITVPGMLHM